MSERRLFHRAEALVSERLVGGIVLPCANWSVGIAMTEDGVAGSLGV
jgi:hypothetical protein